LVEETGQRFVKAATQDSAAWGVALDFVNYKSFLNHSSPTIPSSLQPAHSITLTYALGPAYATSSPQLSGVGWAPKESAAQLNLIGHDHNKDLSIGTAFIFAKGGNVQLDGLRMRHLVFIGVHVVYRGGPVEMTDVYFVDCTFEMPSAPNSHNFAVAILTPGPSITFAAS
jgi:hypothetical protein